MLRASILLLATLLLLFQNCGGESSLSPIPGSKGDNTTKGQGQKDPFTLEGNGDAYEGKTYVNVDRRNQCQPGSGPIKERIRVEGGRMMLVVQNCQPIVPQILSSHILDPHDPDVVFHGTQAYIHEDRLVQLQLIGARNAMICRKAQLGTNARGEPEVSAVHAYWTEGVVNGSSAYGGKAVAGIYRNTDENKYSLATVSSFVKQTMEMVTDMATYLPYFPPPNPSFPNVAMFNYAGAFPAPNSFMLEMMAPTDGGAPYSKAHLVMMEGADEHLFSDLDCYPF